MDQQTLKRISINAHMSAKGKIETIGKVAIRNARSLSIYYTPGVAYACLAIKKNPLLSYEYTSRNNTVAILTNGSRILGLGDIGPEAGMPVMEGKAVLLKKFGGVDAIPLAIHADRKHEIIRFAHMLAPSVGAINLEDIRSPDCVDILKSLERSLEIPVFHDDNQGTGIVAYAALLNALKLVGKRLDEVKIAINGAGAAGYGIAMILAAAGARDITVCDTHGIVRAGRSANMNSMKRELARFTNRHDIEGTLHDAVRTADVLIGASTAGAFNKGMIGAMADDPIVFALANPYPEIDYHDALGAGAAIAATGRSDRPNQVNNLLIFPGMLRGILDVGARRVNMEMMLAAGRAIAGSVSADSLSKGHVVPAFAETGVAKRVLVSTACAVASAAMRSGAARRRVSAGTIARKCARLLERYERIERSVIGKRA